VGKKLVGKKVDAEKSWWGRKLMGKKLMVKIFGEKKVSGEKNWWGKS
jgi:phage gp46-like protein